jgi:hypothetical protein
MDELPGLNADRECFQGCPTLTLGAPIDRDGAGDAELPDFPLPANASPAPAPAAIAAITIHFVWLCDFVTGAIEFVTETDGSGFTGGATGRRAGLTEGVSG